MLSTGGIPDARAFLPRGRRAPWKRDTNRHHSPMKTLHAGKKTALPLKICAVLVFSAAFAQAHAGDTAHAEQADDYAARIDSLIQTCSPRNFSGVILITQHGKTQYAKAPGDAHREHATPIRLADNFRIMSNSKQITAALMLREVEKGAMDSHSPVRKYLPDLPQPWATQACM